MFKQKFNSWLQADWAFSRSNDVWVELESVWPECVEYPESAGLLTTIHLYSKHLQHIERHWQLKYLQICVQTPVFDLFYRQTLSDNYEGEDKNDKFRKGVDSVRWRLNATFQGLKCSPIISNWEKRMSNSDNIWKEITLETSDSRTNKQNQYIFYLRISTYILPSGQR